MMERWRLLLARYTLIFFSVLILDSGSVFAQHQTDIATPDITAIVRRVDASVKSRIDRLASYTVTEHYAVFRGKDDVHPAAEMLVKTTYRKQIGKNYDIVSQSGSSLWRNEVLGTLLDHEKRMSQPGNVETALLNSSNYEMKLDPNA